MPVSTRKANASVHPGQILLNSQQTRRTKQQVEDDNAMAKAAAHASQERAAEKHHTVVECIAQLEDEVALVEKDMQTYANRPDLQNRFTKSVSGRHGHLELKTPPGMMTLFQRKAIWTHLLAQVTFQVMMTVTKVQTLFVRMNATTTLDISVAWSSAMTMPVMSLQYATSNCQRPKR